MFNWHTEPGVVPGEINWPLPSRISVGPLTNYGYEHEVTFPINFHLNSPAESGQKISIAAYVEWLVCREDCVPGRADLSLTVPVGLETPSTVSRQSLRNNLPVEHVELAVQSELNEKEFTLTGVNPWGETLETASFFPSSHGAVDNAAPQRFLKQGQDFSLSIDRAHPQIFHDKTITGLLVLTNTSGKSNWIFSRTALCRERAEKERSGYSGSTRTKRKYFLITDDRISWRMSSQYHAVRFSNIIN